MLVHVHSTTLRSPRWFRTSKQSLAVLCTGADGHRVEQSLVFEQTFDGPSVPTSDFGFETGYSVRNNDAETYTDSEQNVFIDQGELVLQAKAETLGQAQYTSGSVNTAGLHSFTYGRIAAHILVPDGTEVGPAFWMLPEAPGDPVDVCDDTGNYPHCKARQRAP